MKEKIKIGVFDSGLGGLTVLSQLKKILPHEEYIYLGDTLNSPYGEKNPEQIQEFIKKNIEFLKKNGASIIVVACNTASANGASEIAKQYRTKVFNVVKSAVDVIDNEKKILLLATTSTVNSGYYDRLILNKDPEIILKKIPAPLIVPSIEKNDVSSKQIQEIVDGYISNYSGKGFDALILGCTHYPLWREYISKSIGREVKLIDPAEKIAQEVKEFLEKEGNISNKGGKITFYTTKNPLDFNENKNELFGDLFSEEVKLVNL